MVVLKLLLHAIVVSPMVIRGHKVLSLDCLQPWFVG